MTYQLRCDSCDFDREVDDWAVANGHARDHEAAFRDHWVSIHDLQYA